MTAYDYQSAAGAFPPNFLANTNGSYSVTVNSAGPTSIASCDYVAGTYANFPESTPLTPTASLYLAMPLFGVYA